MALYSDAQLSHLVDLGMRADADDRTAEQYAQSLTAVERAEFEALGEDIVERDDPADPGDDDPADPDPAAPPTDPPTAPANPPIRRSETDPPAAGDDVQTLIERALARDNEQRTARLNHIRTQAGDDIPRALVERAMAEVWPEDRVNREFLAIVRSRPEPVGTEGHVGIHSRGQDRDCTLQALQGGLLMREGFDLDDALFARREAAAMLRRDSCSGRWLHRASSAIAAGQALAPDLERSLDMAHRYSDMSLFDICREALRLSGRQIPHDRDDVIQRAVSTSALTTIFSVSVNMQILQSYLGYEDTTRGWVFENDVANFQNQERGRLEKSGGLAKLKRGGEAAHIKHSDATESYVISRYAGQFVVDEQDIIDDRFGGIQGHTSTELGELAAEIRPNLVYAILMGNPNMRDSVALFHADHGNLATTSALAAATLKVAKANMATQTENGRSIQTMMRYLIVPEELEFIASQLVNSAEVRNAAGTGQEGTSNPHQGRFTVVSDPRLDNGVTDPNTGTTHAGSATTWYGSARAGRNTIEVGYRRGTGRAPRMDTFQLTGGRWGMGWKTNIDIGAKAIDWRGLHKATA